MNILAIILAVCLVGCTVPLDTPTLPVEVEGKVDVPVVESIDYKEVGFNEFDSSLISFIDEKKVNENYMISPLSFKYALGLAVLGANGETKDELYKAVGFTDFVEFNALNDRMNKVEKNFNEYNESLKEYKWLSDEEKEDMKITFSIANSVWDVVGEMKDSYVSEVNEKLGAEGFKTSPDKVVNEVNSWVDKKTNSLIPILLEDAPVDLGAVLVNTVYLKSSWFEEFNESISPLNFTTYNNEKVEKEAINKTGNFKYYKDNDTELVILNLNGSVNIAYVLGSNENILSKLNNAKVDKEIYVEVPKMDIDTALDKKELVDYLIDRGVEHAFLPTADFSNIADSLYIGDIIQKTKIKTDEKGVEAAAATAIMMMKNTAFIEKEEPIKFVCDRPFSFYIFTETDGVNDLMFYGKYVK